VGGAILLGAPFFKNFITQIDYPNKRLRLLPKKSIDLKKIANVTLKPKQGSVIPAISIEVKGKRFWVMLDTGFNSGLYIERSFALSNDWMGQQRVQSSVITQGVNSFSSSESFIFDSIIIGPYELEDVPVIIPSEGEATTLGRKVYETRKISRGKKTKGILGFEILKHFILTIDYSDYRAHIVAP